MTHSPSSLAATTLCTLLLTAAASTQCLPDWTPGLGRPGTDQQVNAVTTWDPDGSGPATEIVVLGGYFTWAGRNAAQHVVGYDPATSQWLGLGGIDGTVETLCVTPGGELIAGGLFWGSVARFDGIDWQPLGAGVDGIVRAIAALPNGDLIVGGDFAAAPGFGNITNVARWDGSAWHPLGAGTDGHVTALTVLPNGDVVAAGIFDTAGGVACNRIARWDGTAWHPLGSGFTGTYQLTHTLAALPNGDLLAGGYLDFAGGVPLANLARWDGTNWSTFAGGADGVVFDLHRAANGDLYAAGGFQQLGGTIAPNLARWDGANWSAHGSGTDLVAMAVTSLPNGEVFAGGQFGAAGGVVAKCVARWNGSTWSALADGTDGSVNGLLRTAGGDLVACGWFTQLDGVPAARVARRSGGAWQPLGSGLSHTWLNQARANCAAELPNGDLVIGGYFDIAGGSTVANIARWDGAAWHPLGAGLDSQVSALLVLPNGDLLAGGQFVNAGGTPVGHIARWDGAAWHAVSGGITAPWFGGVHALALLPGGDVVAAGQFSAAGGVPTDNLARWDGGVWHAFGQPMNASSSISELLVTHDGALLVGGGFHTVGGITANLTARWDGAAWTPFGDFVQVSGSRVYALAELPGGDVFAGGLGLRGSNGAFNSHLVRWDGSQWSAYWSPDGFVYALSMAADDELAIGGDIEHVASGSVDFGLIRTPCPATANAFGSGCVGSGGNNLLAAAAPPWLGTTFRATASGIAQNGFAIGVFGFGITSLPLASLLPEGLAGCTLLVTPDALDLATAIAGAAEFKLIVPDNNALTGAALHLQAVPVALQPNGAIAELSASNALTLTIGGW